MHYPNVSLEIALSIASSCYQLCFIQCLLPFKLFLVPTHSWGKYLILYLLQMEVHCFSVSGLWKMYWTDFNDNWWKDLVWTKEEPIHFGAIPFNQLDRWIMIFKILHSCYFCVSEKSEKCVPNLEIPWKCRRNYSGRWTIPGACECTIGLWRIVRFSGTILVLQVLGQSKACHIFLWLFYND